MATATEQQRSRGAGAQETQRRWRRGGGSEPATATEQQRSRGTGAQETRLRWRRGRGNETAAATEQQRPRGTGAQETRRRWRRGGGNETATATEQQRSRGAGAPEARRRLVGGVLGMRLLLKKCAELIFHIVLLIADLGGSFVGLLVCGVKVPITPPETGCADQLSRQSAC